MKKKIALIVDYENWAFDIEANILKNYFKEKYDIEVFFSSHYEDDLFLILEDTKDFDMIHFFWRKLLLQFGSPEFRQSLKKNKMDYDEYLSFVCPKISTGIYDHLFLDEDSISLYTPVFTNYCKRYYTCSKRLETIYHSISNYPSPWGTIHDTYDNQLYDGGDFTRFHNRVRKSFVVGWVGNSNWNIKYKDFKGFHSILEPAIDELIEEGYWIEKHYADRNIQFRSNEEMPLYYQELDCCVVCSIEEGTPRPIIEAMASGVPIISTDVGIVPEVFGSMEKKFIIGNRLIQTDEEVKKMLKEKIKELYHNSKMMEALSEENYHYAKQNSIESLGPLYEQYLDEFLEG